MLRPKLIPAAMQYGFIGYSSGDRPLRGDYTVTAPTGSQYGDLLVVTATAGVNTSFVRPDGWTSLYAVNNASGGGYRSAYTTYSGSTSFTATIPVDDADDVAWIVSAFRGYSYSSSIGTSSVGTNPDPLARTVISTTDIVLLGVGRCVSVGSMTKPTNYTEITQNNGSGSYPNSVGQAQRTGITPGSENPGVWTYGSSTYWHAETILLVRS